MDERIDSLIAHNAYLYRLSTQSVNEILKQFNGLSNEKLSQLRDLLESLTESELTALAGGQYTTDSLKEVRTLMNQWFTGLTATLPETFAVSATALAVYEANYTARLIGEKIKEPNGKTLLNKARKKPFAGGMLIDYMFDKVAGDLRQRVEYTIRDGINSGQTTQQIVQKIKGTKKLNYQDGILNKSRQEINTLVRTARSHTANETHDDVYRQLGFEWLRVLATLDSRTCLFCAGQDGRVYHADDPKRPRFPVHPNNRTIYVPIKDKDAEMIGKRPYVADPLKRSVKDIPKDERDIGQVDANTTYKEWFARQNPDVQKAVLGKTRYDLYKSGKISVDRFSGDNGEILTLAELRVLDEQAFKDMGL